MGDGDPGKNSEAASASFLNQKVSVFTRIVD